MHLAEVNTKNKILLISDGGWRTEIGKGYTGGGVGGRCFFS